MKIVDISINLTYYDIQYNEFDLKIPIIRKNISLDSESRIPLFFSFQYKWT